MAYETGVSYEVLRLSDVFFLDENREECCRDLHSIDVETSLKRYNALNKWHTRFGVSYEVLRLSDVYFLVDENREML